MRVFWFITALLFLPLAAAAQNGCGATKNWTDSACQTPGVGTISSQWTIVARHGEYSQSETECNTPGAINSGSGHLIITTAASAYTCGDFNLNGTTKTTAASWPYNTGDVQWNTFNFKFGTVVWQSAYPASSTNLWPSHWFLTISCQDLNKYSGDTGVGGCPNFGAAGYDEIDAIECFGGSCNMNLYHNGTSQNCFIPSPNWDTASHTWAMNWTSTSLTMLRDGTQICSFSTNIPQQFMFMIIQTQTGGIAGTPVNAQLPATLTTNFVKVCSTSYTASQCSSATVTGPCVGTCSDANVELFDNFTTPVLSTPGPAIGMFAELQ